MTLLMTLILALIQSISMVQKPDIRDELVCIDNGFVVVCNAH